MPFICKKERPVMKSIFPIIIIASLALATLACSINFHVPTTETGELETISINEAFPSGSDYARLTLQMGAGELFIQPGAQGLVQGEITYNVTEWEPKVIREQNTVRIEQGEMEDVKLPSDEITNSWDLALGSGPIDLVINAGAYKGILDLGGLSLVNLNINDGASQAEVRFDSPNLVKMERLRYKTGASEVKLINLANAKTGLVSFDSGAGSYTLDFSGTMNQDMQVDIKSGISTIKIIVPEGVPCKVTINGGLNNISPSGTWTISANIYEKSGSGPRIDISLNMGLGNLELISR